MDDKTMPGTREVRAPGPAKRRYSRRRAIVSVGTGVAVGVPAGIAIGLYLFVVLERLVAGSTEPWAFRNVEPTLLFVGLALGAPPGVLYGWIVYALLLSRARANFAYICAAAGLPALIAWATLHGTSDADISIGTLIAATCMLCALMSHCCVLALLRPE